MKPFYEWNLALRLALSPLILILFIILIPIGICLIIAGEVNTVGKFIDFFFK